MNGEQTKAPEEHVKIPESEYWKVLAERVALIVEERSKRRDAIWKTGLAIFTFVLGFLGITNITNLKKDTSERVLRELEPKLQGYVGEYWQKNSSQLLREEMAAIEARSRDTVAYFQFVRLLGDLEAKESFDQADRDSVLTLLQQFKKSQLTANSPSFSNALDQALNLLMAGGFQDDIPQIEQDFHEVCIGSPAIVTTLTLHFGYQVLGLSEVPKETLEAFNLYIDLSRKSNRSYFYIFRMLVLHNNQLEGAKGKIMSYWDEISRLSANDREKVQSRMREFNNLQPGDKTETIDIRFRNCVNNFLLQYNDQFEALSK